jgi:beta-fructofuranosidase
MSKELMIKNLEKAEQEIASKKDEVSKSAYRQKYHFMAPTGWINDPNGLIYFKGKYHFFYQFYPYSGFWSFMHWGHAVSDDMIHWEHLPVALAPSEYYDNHLQGGCFSGSAIEHDGKLFLMYTGTTNRGKGFEQTQCIAYSEDGIHFEKYEHNPVLTAPEGIPSNFFRDPKVWKHDGIYYMVCGANKNGMSQALLYKSTDMFHWEYVNVLAESRGEWGYMFECPDFFKIGDKYVLVVSPMGVKERTCVYMVGDFDYKTGRFFSNVSGEIDWGHDYYAPASFETPDGRRIMVAWANCWDWMPFWKDWGPTYRDGWCGHFNIPREVYLKEDNTLAFRPIREIETIRGKKEEKLDFILADGMSEKLISGYCYDSTIKVDLTKTDAKQIVLLLRKSEKMVTKVIYDLEKGEVRFVRDQSDDWSKGIARAPLNLIGKKELEIRILSDRISLEIFSNEYQTNLSCNVYTTLEGEDNLVYAKDGNVAIKSVETYRLEV